VLAYNESREDRKPFAGEESSYVRGHAPWANYILGLILQIAQESPRVYRRIGMFAHPWTKKGPNPLAEQFPEFADVVDPRALEREKIVVIWKEQDSDKTAWISPGLYQTRNSAWQVHEGI
jgi:hypothetical protein